MKSKNWFWGLFFLASAILVIASQVTSFAQIGIFSILATIVLAALLINSAITVNFFGIFISIAFLYIIYTKPLNLIYLDPWILIVSAILLSIGFSILFRVKPKMHFYDTDKCHAPTIEKTDDNNPYAKVAFGAASQYLHGDCIKSGQFYVSFGALELFFEGSNLSPEGTEFYLDCSFGAITLYVPRDWKVIDNMRVLLGGVDNNNRFSKATDNSPCLKLTGNVQLGGIEIKYV